VQSPADSSAALYDVSFTVRNTGTRSGAVVPQLYVGAPKGNVPRPLKELKGFARVTLQPGESRQVVLPLDARAFAFYDVAVTGWHAQAGTYRILVGDSSEQISLRDEVTLLRPILVGK
jgi:beta-glucosidase